MSKNVEINIANSSGGYEVLYPKTDYNLLLNKLELPLSTINGGTGVSSYVALANQLSMYLDMGLAYKLQSYYGTGTSEHTIALPNTSKFMIFFPAGDISENGVGGNISYTMIMDLTISQNRVWTYGSCSCAERSNSTTSSGNPIPAYYSARYTLVKQSSLTFLTSTIYTVNVFNSNKKAIVFDITNLKDILYFCMIFY